MNILAIASFALLLLIPQEKAQEKAQEPAKMTDHDSLDTLVVALYDVISGPKGQKRDWKRFESLFMEGAKLQAMTLGRDGKRRFVSMAPADYVKRSGQWAEGNGLYEKETHRNQVLYGHIAHLFSSYELRVGSADKKADMTGINSIQCCQVDGKWRILSLLWEDSQSAGPIPDRFRAKPKAQTPAGKRGEASGKSPGTGEKKDGDDRE